MTPFTRGHAHYVLGLSFGGDLSGPIPEPRPPQERRQGVRVTTSLSRQQVDLPPDRVTFEWNSLEPWKARHVLGCKDDAETRRRHILEVQVLLAAVAQVRRLLGEALPPDFRRDVAACAL